MGQVDFITLLIQPSMSEYMGLISGVYDAKADGFVPGGASLHSIMTPHGPDATTFANATVAELKPTKMGAGIAFMFESCLMLNVTKYALHGDDKTSDEVSPLQKNYNEVWRGLVSHFDPSNK